MLVIKARENEQELLGRKDIWLAALSSGVLQAMMLYSTAFGHVVCPSNEAQAGA